MDKTNNPSELTTTLHLAKDENQPVQFPDHLENLLAGARAEDAHVLREVINGGSDAAMIYIHRGPSQGSRFLITSKGATIGRASSNEIFLDDVTVSRKHGEISYQDGNFIFSDLGSLNGSYVNSVQKNEHHLQSGDEIQIGKFHMLFIGAAKLTGEK
jgi:hypothetical protein